MGSSCTLCGSAYCPGCATAYDAAPCKDCGEMFEGEGDFCSPGCESHYGVRQGNLQRWNMRPKGTPVPVKGGRIA